MGMWVRGASIFYYPEWTTKYDKRLTYLAAMEGRRGVARKIEKRARKAGQRHDSDWKKQERNPPQNKRDKKEEGRQQWTHTLTPIVVISIVMHGTLHLKTEFVIIRQVGSMNRFNEL